MKRKVIILSFALTVLLLNGCGQKDAPNPVPPSTVAEKAQPNTSTQSNATQSIQNTGDETTKISEEEAKTIALDKVTGATTQDIHEFKSDYDNGKLKYEGKIYYEQTEYEFEIDGYTGTILEWDVDPINNSVS